MKTAKLFKDGESQAVRLPKEFRFPGNEVFIKRVGTAVVLLRKAKSWDTLIGSFDRKSRQVPGGLHGDSRTACRHR